MNKVMTAWETGYHAVELGRDVCPFDPGSIEQQKWGDGFVEATIEYYGVSALNIPASERTKQNKRAECNSVKE